MPRRSFHNARDLSAVAGLQDANGATVVTRQVLSRQWSHIEKVGDF
jgi:hypothetical protein